MILESRAVFDEVFLGDFEGDPGSSSVRHSRSSKSSLSSSLRGFAGASIESTGIKPSKQVSTCKYALDIEGFIFATRWYPNAKIFAINEMTLC